LLANFLPHFLFGHRVGAEGPNQPKVVLVAILINALVCVAAVWAFRPLVHAEGVASASSEQLM